jgi:flagellin-specific chaperone FliS
MSVLEEFNGDKMEKDPELKRYQAEAFMAANKVMHQQKEIDKLINIIQTLSDLLKEGRD